MRVSIVLALSALAIAIKAQDVSENGKCGADADLSCQESEFGPCCSQFVLLAPLIRWNNSYTFICTYTQSDGDSVEAGTVTAAMAVTLTLAIATTKFKLMLCPRLCAVIGGHIAERRISTVVKDVRTNLGRAIDVMVAMLWNKLVRVHA
ncbi:hypothetical protein J1614_006382 [Plenodomus biglobosus]|nr:hypothetical protein J1614_006382 [Plenodomus biglobosus]